MGTGSKRGSPRAKHRPSGIPSAVQQHGVGSASSSEKPSPSSQAGIRHERLFTSSPPQPANPHPLKVRLTYFHQPTYVPPPPPPLLAGSFFQQPHQQSNSVSGNCSPDNTAPAASKGSRLRKASDTHRSYTCQDIPGVPRYSPERVSSSPRGPRRQSSNAYKRSSDAYHLSPTPQPQSLHRPRKTTRSRSVRQSVPSPQHRQNAEIQSPLVRMKRFFKRMTRGQSQSPPRRRHTSSGRRRERRHSMSATPVLSTSRGQDEQVFEDEQVPVQPPMPLTPFPEIINNPLRFAGYRTTSTGEVHPLYVPITPQQAQSQASAGQSTTPQSTSAGVSAGAGERESSRKRKSREEPKAADIVHFCQQCGNARSKSYHKKNPVLAGSAPRASCCSSCRRKNRANVQQTAGGYPRHFCAGCGIARSKQYHADHPVAAGETPRPSMCRGCRTQIHGDGQDGDWEDISEPAEPRAGGASIGGGVPANAPGSNGATPVVQSASSSHPAGENRTFVVVVQPCSHQQGQQGHPGRRRQVTFSQPEVTGRFEAHADEDYDRSAVPEAYWGEEEEEVEQSFGHTPNRRRSSFEARPRFDTPPAPFGAASTQSSGGLFSSPEVEEETPPPGYEPPKLLTPDEIRRLWATGPQPQRPQQQEQQQQQQQESAGSRYQGSREPGKENSPPSYFGSRESGRGDDRERLDGQSGYQRMRDDSRGGSSSQGQQRRPGFAWTEEERARFWAPPKDPELERKMRESTERLMRAARANNPFASFSAGASQPAPESNPPESKSSDSPNLSSTDSRPRSPDFTQGYVPRHPSTSHSREPSKPPFPGFSSSFDHGPPLQEIPIGKRRCGPACNRFCLHRDDFVEREIVELESGAETERLDTNSGEKGKNTKRDHYRAKPSGRHAAQHTSRTAPAFSHSSPILSPPMAAYPAASPARSTSSAYFSATSEI